VPLVASVRVRGFRSARDVEIDLGSVTALVGEARSGKSNILRAIRALLDPTAPLGSDDLARDQAESIRVEARLEDGRRVERLARPPEAGSVQLEGAPPVIFLPASERSGRLVDVPALPEGAPEAVRLFLTLREESRAHASDASGATAVVSAVEACSEAGLTGFVLLVEEPELFLRPHTQRYLYRRLRALASAGNQVLYSTHSPAFLNVARLEELVLVGHDTQRGTHIAQPERLAADETFKFASEFDAERSELFLARAAILVEGRTEKLVFPALFAALGHDADRDQVSIVECGGKSNIPVFVQICRVCEIPFVVVHDRDAELGKEPIPAEVVLNQLIADVAGAKRTIVLAPDFEGATGLRGHRNKPERAWEHFSQPGVEVPEPLVRAVRLALRAARR
jgi:predicted ATPase